MIWPRRAREAVDGVQTRETVYPGGVFPLAVPTWDEYRSWQSLTAGLVPAYTRGVRLISGTVAQLPVDTDGRMPVELGVPAWVTMQRLVQDLIEYGRGYWYVTVDVGDLFEITTIHAGRVSKSERPGHVTIAQATDVDTISGDKPVSGNGSGRVIEFTGYRDGTLTLGVDAITTAASHQRATRLYAESPAPSQILKNTSQYELSDTEIDALLTGYAAARKAGSVAYLNGGVDLTSFGYSAADLELTSQQNNDALDMARLLGLDPMWVGASVSGSSLTYQNRVDARQDLIDLTLTDYMTPIEQRMSMPDVCGAPARFDTSEFLRANLSERARMAIDLFTAGIITQDEARTFITDRSTGGPA